MDQVSEPWYHVLQTAETSLVLEVPMATLFDHFATNPPETRSLLRIHFAKVICPSSEK